ncbi:MAG: thioredoxin family protein [Chitinophagaceae bacterium]
MMNKLSKGIWILALLVSCSAFSQDMKKFNLYKPGEDAEKKIEEVIREAKKNKKHVFIQIGGNWCIWCARFNEFVTRDAAMDSLVKANYVVYHMNYSPENYNNKLLAKFGFPQRFGFPVFLILDGKGSLLHTQNSAYLEEGKSYSQEKVKEFFYNWSPAALDPGNYKEK